MPTLPVSCGCGRAFSADEWMKLPLVGATHADGAGGFLELRNCPCGSTKARSLPKSRGARIRTLMADEGCSLAEARALVDDAISSDPGLNVAAASVVKAPRPGRMLGAELLVELAKNEVLAKFPGTTGGAA